MKAVFILFGVLGLSLNVAQANSSMSVDQVVSIVAQDVLASPAQSRNVIDWKVGDTANFQIKIAGLPFQGTSVKTVTKDEGSALWLKNEVNIMIQRETVEMLLNKADGKVLKMIRNGQEQELKESNFEVISQDFEEVTVPAGKFQAIHVVVKSEDIEKGEVWANPRDTVMDGTLKQVITPKQNNTMTITMELTRFTRK